MTIQRRPGAVNPFTLLFFFFLVFLLMPVSKVGATEHIGSFTSAEGTVEVLKKGVLPALPAKIKDLVYLSDTVRTKSGAKAEITFLDGTVLRIGQRSRIDISEYATDGQNNKNIIKLPRGKAEAIVDPNAVNRIKTQPTANRFEIHTPNAVAGVRGTNFFVSFEKNITIALVKAGFVCVNNLDSPESVVCMPPSFITSVTGLNVPEQPRLATPSEINRFEIETQPAGPIPKSSPEVPAKPSAKVLDQGAAQQSLSPAVTGGPAMNLQVTSVSIGTPSRLTDIPIVIPFTDSGSTVPPLTIPNTLGYWADTSPSTGIYIGEPVGTFNPANPVWQPGTSGAWFETGQYLQMIGNDAGRFALQQLNIPAIEVGRTNLSGALVAGPAGAFDSVSVFMNNVIFLAPSSGQRPALWATNSITGNYDFSHGILGGTTGVFTLSSGSGITAGFQFTQWNGSAWTAAISNGAGNLNGGSYSGPVSFLGAGAGTVNGGLTGTITGTGAGISR